MQVGSSRINTSIPRGAQDDGFYLPAGGAFCWATRGVLEIPATVSAALPESGIKEFLRILKYPLNEHFKMQMGSRRTPGATHLSNLLPTLDQITLLYQGAGRMGIACHQLVAMIQLDHVPIGRVKLLSNHHPTSSCQDGGASIRLKIKPCMQRRLAGEWIQPPPKSRSGRAPVSPGHALVPFLADVLIE